MTPGQASNGRQNNRNVPPELDSYTAPELDFATKLNPRKKSAQVVAWVLLIALVGTVALSALQLF